MSSVDIKYDEELVKCIRNVFINKIVPENFLLVIHKYDDNVLTVADIQRLRKSMDTKSTSEVNYDVLLTMKNYQGWFEVILNACKDSDVKQEYLVSEFKELKKNLDEKWFSSPDQINEVNFKLRNLALASDSALESDGLAACAAVVDTKSETENRQESSAEVQSDSENQISNKDWEMKDGRGYCFLCSLELTSEKHKDSHITGKGHFKKAKNMSVNVSFDETQTSTATDPAPNNYYTLNDDGIGKCNICDVAFTSHETANQHLKGNKHKKKIDAFNVPQSMGKIPKLGPNKETYVVNEKGIGTCYLCEVSLTSKENAGQHLEGRNHKNKCKEYGIEVN